MLRQREAEIREELSDKTKASKSKYTGEISRLTELLKQREHELDLLERQMESLRLEKAAVDRKCQNIELELLEF